MKQRLTLLLTALLLLTGLSLSGQTRTEVTDVLNRALTGVTGTTYQNWSNVTSNSDAVYAGQSAGGNESIQLRSNNSNSGIITTASGGTVTNVSVTWNSSTATGRTLNVYGSNSPYTSPTELYSSSTQGTLIGTIVCGTNTELDISDTYTHIGLRSNSGAMYLEEINITWTTGGSTPNPSITANNVEIEYNSNSGSIEYTVNNPVSGGILTANTTSDWLTLGTVDSTVPFNCTTNNLSTARSASVTLTYTYNTDQTVTKNVTVTQNGNPNVINNISDITSTGTYTVQGTIVAKSNRGFIVGDGTGYIYYYNTSYPQSNYSIGDMVKLSGSVVAYGGVFEFNNSAVVTTATTSNYVEEEPTLITGAEMDNRVASTTQAQLSTYVQYVGVLTVSGTYYNITNIEGATTAKGSISYPLNTDFTSLNGQEVIVKGYFVGVSSSQYYNTMLGSVEESVVLDPILTVSVNQLSDFRYTYDNGPSQAKTFTVSGSDLSNDIVLTAPQNYELSHSPNNGYFDSETLSPVSGTLTETTIYVRLKAGLEVGNYNGNLTVVCDTLSHSIALSGVVSEQPVTSAPVFSLTGGDFITAQTVSMSCETEGATIYYTTDGTEPTESSSIYSTPIEVSETTTLKAMAAAPTYANSAVTSATYTIHEVVSIATARTLDNNQYACVEGTVTYKDGRNVYIQDATGGIDLYLNSNTVPLSLSLGDNVRAYGKKTTFNGLVELTGIAGNNANVFIITSTSNPLPLTTITISEINADFNADNLLQATRVKIENAIIGSINPSGTTLISQEGNTMNVYHIPSVTGMIQGDWVTLTGVIGCYNTPQLMVASADDIQYTHRPVLTADPTSLSGFTYDYEDGGPSDIQSFLLTGNYLTGRVEVYPSENFEVSTFAGENFYPETPALIFVSTPHFTNLGIHVRMKAALEAGTYNEQIYAVSENADTLFINLEGTVTGGTPTPPDPPTPPTPGDGNYVRINDLNLLTEGSHVVFAARFNENATDYYAMSNQSSGKPTGVLFTSTTADENEVLPTSIVDEESSYYWTVGVTANGYTFTNTANELIGYNSSTNFYTGGDNTEWAIEQSTAGEEAMVPGYTGFIINNVNNTARCFALNSNHNFGPYHTQNLNSSSYNFYLDLFVKTEGGDPPTPTVATPTFTPAAGTYFEEQSVSIACETEGATIHYSTVSENGPWNPYMGAIPVDETMTIWAYAEMNGYNNSPVAEATYIIQLGFVTIFNQDWEGEMNSWTFVDVEGDASWSIASYQGNHYAYANGYNHGANEDWCISPAFNIDAYENPTLSFRTAKKFDGNPLEVFFSNNYNGVDPNAIGTSWQPLLSYDLSQGNYIWVESGNIILDTCSGTNCYIGFKYTCEESQAAAWEVDDILLIGQTSAPVVTVAPLALTGFTYIEGNGPSDSLSFMVSGINLSNSITITTSMNYEISLGSESGFTQEPITLTPDNGNLEETPIYVRLKAGLPIGEYTGEEITITCDDVDDIIVNCSGTVTEQPVPGDDYVRISDVGELAAGNRVILASRYNETSDSYLAFANTITSGRLNTTAFTSVMNGDEEIIPADILADEDSYYWTVDVTADGYTFTNATGVMIGYGNSGTNFVSNGVNTAWTITRDISDTASMVPEYYGFNIINATNTGRGMALRVTETESIVKAYATSNMNNSEYNFFLDIFMQGEGGVPPTPTVAAPTFNPVGGTYYEAQEVTINCATADATIYYSLVPEPYNWIEYDGPIAVDSSMTICAYAAKDGCNDSPIVCEEYTIQDDIIIIFWQEWEDDWDPWHGWTERCTMGDSLWRVASYAGNHYGYANGYNHPETEDWLISPAFDIDSYSDVVLTFNTAKNYNGPDLEVYFSNDYDGLNPDSANWQRIVCDLSQGGWNWVPSGEISLDTCSGSNCYIGFKYTCTNEEAAGWEVDDIKLVSGSTTPLPTLIATPNYLGNFSYVEGNGPSESQSYVLSGVNLEDEGVITIYPCSWYEISLDDIIFTGEPLSFSCAELPMTIYVRMMAGLEPHTYDGVYIANEYADDNNNYAAVVVNLSGVVHYENEPMMNALMPLYIQGNNGSNNNRVPLAVPAQFANLNPNTTYHYTNQLVDGNDSPETAGAGNVIYTNPDGFYRSTSPSLATEGSYGEFTTDDEGYAFVWLMNEPTANARFTPGNHVFMRVRLNDGAYGVTVLYTFTSEDYATVLNFGTENDEYSGSAFYAKSNEASMSFALMYTEYDSERPAYTTSIETTGVDFGSINQYADFYKELVAGNDGWFGGILPNNNETGITLILTTSMDAQTINEYHSEDGQWAPDANTINPANGLDEPIFIDLTDDGVDDNVAANVKVWNANKEFVIENGDDCTYAMNVVNVLGQTVMSCEIEANSTQRIAHHLAAGIYVINLQNNRSNIAVKVLVR